MGILNRWRQFGRRYFWPHLLLGVVAAGIGAPASLNGLPQQVSLSAAFSDVNPINPAVPGVGQLALSREINTRPLQNLNPWQHFAIRNYLTRLAVSFPQDEDIPDEVKVSDDKLTLSHHALLDSLSIQAAIEATLPSTVSRLIPFESTFILHPVRFWLSKVQGIRAGPSSYA
ncbi:secA translation cis-regulator SecM [Jinshanibacter sp. LJY008]|uniref:SecA translation cis-regulator SecM n=1 Tax=Limnobaculum eriocheiris TaxID=2897391 RepID=A0A9X1SPD9_9GAMM|nr:secA translation cis-regulator SecM [Limnobaculum eriocheiris]MCD1125962.1 secA translation cis-regulator SecM [Limnobaculum eriocheiris]